MHACSSTFTDSIECKSMKKIRQITEQQTYVHVRGYLISYTYINFSREYFLESNLLIPIIVLWQLWSDENVWGKILIRAKHTSYTTSVLFTFSRWAILSARVTKATLFSSWTGQSTWGKKLFRYSAHHEGSTWVKNEVRHGHFKSCRNPTWPFIKTNCKVTSRSTKSDMVTQGKIKCDMWPSINYLDPCGALSCTSRSVIWY